MTRPANNAALITTLTTAVVVMGSNSFVLSPVLTDVARDFATTPVVIARVIAAFGAATALSSFFLAGWIDRLGIRRVLRTGALFQIAGLAGSAMSVNWIMLALSQIAVGAAVGMMLPAVYASATASAPPGQGARVLGRILRGWGISLVLSVPASAFIAEWAGWRTIYALIALAALLTLFGFHRLPKPDSAARHEAAIFPARALGLPGILPLIAICLGYMTAFYGIYAYLGDHVRQTLAVGSAEAGLVVLGYGAGFGLTGYVMGLFDRFAPGRALPFVLGVIAIVYVTLIPGTTHLLLAMLTAFVWGLVNHAGLNLLIQLLAGRHPSARGSVMGLQTSATYLAVFLGPMLLGGIYAQFGFDLTVGAATALILASAVLAWRIATRNASASDA